MLTERELLILQTIIDDFIHSAHPVGSRALSKNEKINLSAATIRNVMADLEEMDLLEKTHSSSGRVPSEKGYRYYVDHVISPTLKAKEINVIKNAIEDNIVELEQLAQLSVDVLSQLTNYTAIYLGPNSIGATLKQIQIVPLSANSAVAILVTSTGHVEHRSFKIPQKFALEDLTKLINILNERLIGVPISQLSYALETEVFSLMRKHVNNYELMFEYLRSIIAYDDKFKFYIGGQSNLLTQPEFKDVDKVYQFYTMLEDENEIIDLLSSKNDGLHISIGKENQIEAIKSLSLITSTFNLGLNQLGTFALIGPTRMEYRKVISLLQSLSKELTQLIQKNS